MTKRRVAKDAATKKNRKKKNKISIAEKLQSVQEERSCPCQWLPFKQKYVRAIIGQHHNVNLRNNTNHVFSIFNTTNIEPKQVLKESSNRTEKSPPSSPQKKAEVVRTLPRKFDLRIAGKISIKKKESSKEEEEWNDKFLEKSNIMCTIPGRRDTLYVGMDGCTKRV